MLSDCPSRNSPRNSITVVVYAPLPASLNWEHYSWQVRVYAPDPDAEDCDIVF